MNKIPTAEEFSNNNPDFFDKEEVRHYDIIKGLIEFTKLHVQAALEAAAENSLVKCRANYAPFKEASRDSFGFLESDETVKVDRDSILNAYPEHLIK